MKDLMTLVAECESELRSLGYKPCENITWSVNTRAKKRWGQCKYTSATTCSISIAERLLQDHVDDQAVKNTIMHELIHTISAGNGKHASGHTGRWKEIAAVVNYRLPQYTIKRTTSSAEKGIEPIVREKRIEYTIRCTHCGKEYHRERMSKLVSQPERYRCGNCGHKLERIQ